MASMTEASGGVLLDTCAVIWLANGDRLRNPATEAIIAAGLSSGIFVSPISAWEVGLLARPSGRNTPPSEFLPTPKAWFARVMAGPGIRPAPFTPDIAIDASHLPGEIHGDPADRMIVATARQLSIPVVTRDARILAYARRGHVAAIRC
jgi:PIN domain nuclease of toxin-antitoxin system